MLKWFVLAIAAVYFGVAAFLFAMGASTFAIAFLGVNGLLILLAVLLERRGYRPKVDRRRGHWEPTGERFVDVSSGKVTEVLYNPETGQRDYVEEKNS